MNPKESKKVTAEKTNEISEEASKGSAPEPGNSPEEKEDPMRRLLRSEIAYYLKNSRRYR